MQNTGIWRQSTIIPKRALGYDPRLMGEYLAVPINDGVAGIGGGGLYSTAEDLHKWDQGLSGDALLSEASKNECFEGGKGGYGLGWYITPFEIDGTKHKLIRHSGVADGFGCVVWRFPKERNFVTILQNNSAVPWGLANDILNVLYDSIDGMQPPAKARARDLITTLLRQGIEPALELYTSMPKDGFRKRQCGPRQATGQPNSTARDSDVAWASRTPDDQREWLILDFGSPLKPKRIEIHENYNPGAVDRISIFDANGKEIDIPLSYQERKKDPKGVSVLSIPVDVESETTRLKIYINSPGVEGWNEIDAVNMIDEAGDSNWAKEARASSTGADGSPHTSLTNVPNSAELNKLGQQFLELDRLDDANLVFSFNVQAHPESIVAQQSLSEIWSRLGNPKKAGTARLRAEALERTDQRRIAELLQQHSK
jgi:hypothetical protein